MSARAAEGYGTRTKGEMRERKRENAHSKWRGSLRSLRVTGFARGELFARWKTEMVVCVCVFLWREWELFSGNGM